MTRQEQLNEAWCKYMGKCSTEIMQALAFALRWCDEHPHWISVEDELPKEKGWYLVTDGKTFTSTTRWFGSCWGVGYYQPTHWMNLPAAPKKGGEE